MGWEDIATAAVFVIAIAGIFAIAFMRDRRTHAAFREFARRHGLAFTEPRVVAGVLARGEGKLDGKDLYAGYVWVEGFREGIGPQMSGRSIAVVALTVGSTAGIDRQAPVVREFLEANGSLTDSAITFAFPKRKFKAISLEELNAALDLVRRVAATAR